MDVFKEITAVHLVTPRFEDDLTDILMELNHLRKMKLMGSTEPQIFFQIKEIFNLLESVGSARIEGNHTTVPEYIDHKIEHDNKTQPERFSEIQNVESALEYIETNLSHGDEITHSFIKELHQLVVSDLTTEGDANAGGYREVEVRISQSEHTPPPQLQVHPLMDELLSFLNKGDAEKYDLLKIAIAHHRFAWIHPFGNGNGRVVRLLTYALLIKYGFNVKEGKLINPTAVFCNNRTKYYDMLSVADTGEDQALLQWCEYVLAGFLKEVSKNNNLLDYNYLKDQILVPTVTSSRDKGLLLNDEANILLFALPLQSFTAQDLAPHLKDLNTRQRAHRIKKLKDSGLITSMPNSPRTYYIDFTNKLLLRVLVSQLQQNGIIQFEL